MDPVEAIRIYRLGLGPRPLLIKIQTTITRVLLIFVYIHFLFVPIIHCNTSGRSVFSPLDQNDEHEDHKALCARAGLAPKDNENCLNSPGIVNAINSGTKLGLAECQHQFRWSRWNCTVHFNTNRHGIYGTVVNPGTREAAYVSSITSAAVTYTIAKACARGNITTCGCAPPTTIATNGNTNVENKETTWESISSVSSSTAKAARYWRWGGCSADVEFAVKLSRKFVDSKEIEYDAWTAMNLHNNKAGRKTVQITLDTECKCHGVSGSCTLKTCWLKLPPFRRIGEKLLLKYKKAKVVQALSRNHTSLKAISHKMKKNWMSKNNVNNSLPVLTLINSGLRQGVKVTLPRRTELVYLDNSPNYCEPDASQGSLGTHSRRCIKTNSTFALTPNLHQGGCDILCCGRGYNTHQVWRRWKCHCKFRWCCVVECQDCQQRVEVYTCN